MILVDDRVYMIGKEQAEVVSDVDPENNRRLKVRIYALHDDDTPAADLPWARACIPWTGNDSGEKPRPNKGQKIWVSFEGGDPDFPIWEGGFLEENDAPSGHRKVRLDGRDTLEVKQGQQVTINGSQTLAIKKNQAVSVEGKLNESFAEVSTIVIGDQTVTIGRRSTSISGNDSTTIAGDSLWSIVGNQKIKIAGSESKSIGGTMRQLVLEQAIIRALNYGGLPTASAIMLEGVNGGVKAVAKSLAGIEGASLNLDPLGLLSSLKSLVSLSIESPVIRIGPTKDLAIVPFTTLPHTHLAFGIPTTPTVPGAGAPLTVLGPAL